MQEGHLWGCAWRVAAGCRGRRGSRCGPSAGAEARGGCWGPLSSAAACRRAWALWPLHPGEARSDPIHRGGPVAGASDGKVLVRDPRPPASPEQTWLSCAHLGQGFLLVSEVQGFFWSEIRIRSAPWRLELWPPPQKQVSGRTGWRRDPERAGGTVQWGSHVWTAAAHPLGVADRHTRSRGRPGAYALGGVGGGSGGDVRTRLSQQPRGGSNAGRTHEQTAPSRAARKEI